MGICISSLKNGQKLRVSLYRLQLNSLVLWVIWIVSFTWLEGCFNDGGHWVVQARVEMVTIEEGFLLGCTKCSRLFQGQNWDFYWAALACSLLWVCKIWESVALLVDSLEGLCCSGFSLICWARFSSSACYYVELLS